MKEIENQNATGVSEVNLAPLSPAELAVLAAGLPPRVESSAEDIAARLAARRNRMTDDFGELSRVERVSASPDTPPPQDRAELSADLRKRVMRAIFDPGATEGFKGDRDLTTWQTDAVMRLIATSEGK